MKAIVSILLAGLFLPVVAQAAEPPLVVPDTRMPSGVWISDQGDGTYINPVLQGDYSDPDVVRVEDDYYLTASSFTNVPGLPILHSKDLVNWTLIGHALARNVPEAHHAVPRRGGGVWAPAIRHHNGKFMIYYPDPDFGIFLVTAVDPKGPWSAPVLVDSTKGAIDPAPFWDTDGQGYLVIGFAGSRAGIKNIITLKKLNADGTKTVDEGVRIIEGDKLPKVKTSQGLMPWFTTEGPKLYKRGEWYYIFAPSGSVKGGWQGVFRSKSIYGPYEGRSVIDQGNTDMNGPHQGAWVDTAPKNGKPGEDWFLHFQDTDSYGRRVMLQPMHWQKDGWPIIGERQKGQVYGQPVWRHKKPALPSQPIARNPVDDDFDNGYHLGWQWSSNPGDDWVDQSVKGALRLKSVSSPVNLWEAGNLLTQKLPGMGFSAATKLTLTPNLAGERAGLLVLGYDYGWIGLENTADGVKLVQVTRPRANAGGSETVLTAPVRVDGPVWVRARFEPVTVADPVPQFPHYWPSMLRSTHARVAFSYSLDGVSFTPVGTGMMTQPGRWVGTQIGLFAQAASGTPAFVATRVGYAQFDNFSVVP
ncbi:glycoside hydrolase family 43 protein [Asticcacaulis endophyticus]|uniref:Glycoside hydrolase n=1 Tax=Asticcacaulis endophyticus TaxID=1395890 RepID=A0A918QGN3_9CAUL|nr:glycoside hydrolase 43 family protein [Asticcacaulis endophyticus]GGZ44916.1 glycoside hydrolase [Asticcacaulis endophyticus]